MKRPLALIFVAVALVATALWEAGCASPAPPISASLSPASAQMDMGQSVGISTTLANDTLNKGVSWSLSGSGSLSNETAAAVTYNAPAPSNISNAQIATITATSIADRTKGASIQITVNPVPQVLFQSLPSGTAGTAYNQPVMESGGTPPFTWSVPIGAVPNGLSLNSNTGVITGPPAGGGTWYFDAQLTDAAGLSADNGFLSIEIYSNVPPGNPVPFVNQPLVPDATAPGGTGFTLTVNGTGFISGATVDFNGAPLTTTFVSSKQLTAQVPPADIAVASTASITVVNPTPGGGRSNALFFPIATPETTVNFSNPVNPPFQMYAPRAVVVGDFGNGKPDLAAASYGGTMRILLSNGDGTFAQAPGSPIQMQHPPYNTEATVDPVSIALGDFNNTGNLGLAVADYSNEDANIFLGNGNGSFALSGAFANTQGGGTGSVAAADFNGDGNLDLVANNFTGLSPVLLGYGDGAFNLVPASLPFVPGPPGQIAVGDFNGDGKLDLALGSWTDTVSILLGNGDGTFTVATGSPITVGNAPEAVVVGDFNGDGKLDLAVAGANNNTVTILLGNGDGTFTPAPGSPIPVGTEPEAIVVGDFTGNGKLDLAVANYGSNNVTLLLGNGDGTFTQAASSPYTVGNRPDSIVAGDFNGDGRLDLAVANLNDNTVSILLQQ